MTVQAKAQNAASTALTVAEDLRDFVRTRSKRLRSALGPEQEHLLASLRRDGFAVLPGFWERDRALAMRERLESYLKPGMDADYDSGAYLRVWDNRAYDQGVRRLYHVDREIPELREFREDAFVMELAAAYYGMPFHSAVLVFQHNTRSNENTRYYHVDAFSKEFKSFLYLDDVDEGNGPFTYLRGTHKHHLRRLTKQIVGNKEGSPTSFYPEDLGGRLQDEVQISGPAGTLIVTDVRGFHRGSPQLRGSRSVLVNYLYKEPGDRELDR